MKACSRAADDAERAPTWRQSVSAFVDYAAFAFGGAAAVWFAYLVVAEGLFNGWAMLPFLLLFWMMLAYLVLPRLHRILTFIYVPDYFIGRARTSDGLLGDPINLAFVGSEQQLHEAMTRSGWIRADPVTLRSSWRIITATVLKRSYDEAPVSPLLLFGHPQDLAYQQDVAGSPGKRHHVRIWRCPDGWVLPGGHHADWMAAGTFDRAVGFSLFTLQITHKIAADTDTERDHIVRSLKRGGSEISVRVIEEFASGYHSRNGGGDSIVSDGDLPVVDVGHVTIPTDGSPLGPDTAERRNANANRRPVSTTLGVAFMSIRLVVGIIAVTLLAENWKRMIANVGSTLGYGNAGSVGAVLIVTIVVAGVAILLYGLLAVLIFRGSDRARILSMLLSALLVTVAAVEHFLGESVIVSANLFGLPLDILVLLALSARSSTHWARRPRPRGPARTPAN